jgi:hypothetical protein
MMNTCRSRLARYSVGSARQEAFPISSSACLSCCCARVRYNCPSGSTWSTYSTCSKGLHHGANARMERTEPSLESQWHPLQSCQQDLHRKPCLGRIWPEPVRWKQKISALAADTPLGPRPIKCAMRHPSELLCCCAFAGWPPLMKRQATDEWSVAACAAEV